MHFTEFEKQVQSIFQVKIKDNYINKLFQGVKNKLSTLQIQLEEIKSGRYNSQHHNSNLQKLQEIVIEQINSTIHPLASKIDQLHLQIQQSNKKQQDIQVSIQQMLKSIANKQFQLIQQQRVKNNEEFRMLRQEMKRMAFRNEAIQKALNDQIEESSFIEEKYQFQIQKVWEAINGYKEQQTNVESKKRREPKHSNFYRLNQSKENNRKQEIAQTSSQKNKIISKEMFQSKKSLIKQSLNSQSRRQSKAVQYACLLLKIQALQKKVQEFIAIKPSMVKIKSSFEEQVRSKQSMPKLQDSNQRIIVERKKMRPSNTLNRMNRCSIVRNQYSNQDIDLSRDEISQTNATSLQLKKVNEKLAQLKYKYILLQQNHEIVLNKISRVTQIESSLNNKMDQIQKLRIDQSTINEINMRFRKIQASYQQQQHKYVFNQAYKKDVKLIKDNVKDIEAKINKMANKGEVKEAFVFIETKIKEMALVLTDKFQNQKEGAINKIKQVKCLTCDKECDENYAHIRMSLNRPHCRNVKTSNQYLRLKRKARITQKKIKTQSSQNFQVWDNLISKPFE